VNFLMVPSLSIRLEFFLAMIAMRGVILQLLHSFKGFWKFWNVDWGVDLWEWNMEEVLVGAAYDF
jgi:hypothetical protein